MSQDPEQTWTGEPADPVRTGNDVVDAVIDEVAGLDERPLEDHAHVFETAQERLRHALDVPSASL
jgi:hypothetical protein